ncbi:MAG: biotin synthase [Rhodoferax sp.]
MPTQRPPTIDPIAAQRWAQRVVAPSAWLHEEVARRMQERLRLITLQPRNWVHWEPLRGGLQAQALLGQCYPDSTCYVLQTQAAQGLLRSHLQAPWWKVQRWRGPKLRFAKPPQPVQMLWANMALHMEADPQAVLAQWHELLASDGFVMFSCLGPDTLRELRAAYAAQGWPPASHEFTDMHDWGDMLLQAGFAEPVMDVERVTLTFATPQRLLVELRELGRNLHPQRFAGLRGRAWLAQLHGALDRLVTCSGAEVALPLSFEIIYGHAFKPPARMQVRPLSTLSLQDMRAALARGKGQTVPARPGPGDSHG